ncbi:VWA domain-containing protein [Siphonobacter aquaeclarae]|jgi:Ca-activated chloride channel family protein|uniref:Ca-activated chloride channel family protein n=1 Tax=Siphonobacter aquaeclarae TaxID=563176 RepID=A0A1G9Q9H1_9BACT|nr:VWA domain-containing protein [Siphonobacter aquaeclarae]SDM07714.1 Ca-activated chloride channel family protein [Siphonobacter aquaeclarae]
MEDWLSLKWFSFSTLSGYQWAVPYYLYAIPAVPLLFFLRRAFHGKARQKLNVAFLAKEAASGWIRYLRHIPGVFMFIGMLLVLVALARPQIVKDLEERYADGIEIVLALDVSDSMLEKDLAPDRLESAKKVAIDFIDGRFQDKIGLVVFAGQSFFLCPLTTDYALLKEQIRSIKSGIIPTAGTAIGSALANCINLMRETTARSKIAILLSDGDNTAGNLDPLTAAQLAASYKIRVYTIGIGREGAVRDSVGLETLDTGVLRQIAGTSGGQFFQVEDAGALRNVFGEINRLEKTEIKTSRYQEVKDYYHVYLRWAIVCLLAAFACKLTFISNILED